MLGITPEDAVDNFAVLAALAGKAAEWATTRITRRAAGRAARPGRRRRRAATTWWPPTGRFHRALNLASGSPRLLTYLRQAVRVVPANYFELFPEQDRRSRAEHAALLEAIGRGDAGRAPAPSPKPTCWTPAPRWATGCGTGPGTRTRDGGGPEPAIPLTASALAAATARRARCAEALELLVGGARPGCCAT